MRRVLLRALTAFLLFLPLSNLLRADVNPQYFGQVIRRIDYQADRELDRSRYDAVIGLKPGSALTHSGLKGALQALYDTGRFSTIATDASAEDAGVVLTFNLRLNYYFNTFRIEGDVNVKGRSPSEVMSLPIGEHFSEDKLETARQTVEKFLKDQGFFQAQVGVRLERNENNRQIDTVFLAKPGDLARVRSLEIHGVPPGEEQIIREKLGFDVGGKYKRARLRKRLDGLREYFLKRGFLAAVPELSDNYSPADNTVDLVLAVTNFGRVRVVIDGFKIERSRLRRLLPVLSGEGIQPDLLEEGVRNLKDFLDEQGYPEAVVNVDEEVGKKGAQILRYRVDAGRKVTVADVRFKGNNAISTADLLGAIQIQPAGFLQKSVYSVTKLDSDVDSLRTLYNSRGYLAAEVIPLVKSVGGAEKLAITFECKDGPLSRTAAVELKNNRGLATEALRKKMELQPGKPYSPHIAERDRQALLAAYNDAGFLQARVIYHAARGDAENTYLVVYEIMEGTQTLVDEIFVLGNEHTRQRIIGRRIKLESNKPLSLGKMLETQQSLYNVGVFDRVRVAQQNPESATAYQNVVVRLEEAKRFTLRYGLGYQETERLRGILELSDLNFLGTGQRADLRLRGSSIEQAGVLSFQQPQFRYLPVNSFFTLSAQQKKEVSFDVKRYNLSYQYSWQASSHAWGLLRYNFRNVRTSNVRGTPPGREDSPRNLSTISAIYINDTRDNYLDPERGFFTSTDLSLTTKLLGSNNYYSMFTQNSYYRRLAGSLLMASSLRFGFMHPFGNDTDIPISERYFAGGGSSLRGFETDMAGPLIPGTSSPNGGNALFIINLEARAPLFRALHLAGFYDGGNVFGSLSTMRWSEVSHSVGLGLRIKTPFGPLRADYGFNLNLPESRRAKDFKSGHLFLTIGPPF